VPHRRRKSKRLAARPRCDSPGRHDADSLRSATKALGVPDEEVEAQRRRYALRRRLKNQAVTWSSVTGGLITGVGPLVASVFPNGLGAGGVISMLGLMSTFGLHWLILKAGRSRVELPALEMRLHQGRDERQYAQLLDHFEIELAVVRPEEGEMICVSKLAEDQPSTRTAKPLGEQRFVLGMMGSEVPAVGKALLRRAGVTVGDDQLVLFCFPRQVEEDLCRLEREACFGDLGRVRKTVFSVRQRGQSYELYVAEQEYMQPAALFQGRNVGAQRIS